ncbi:MAG TPA: peptidylprolyl isomerase [Aggregatilineales bacterium]|nr:peptidylprolyl isomerase [Aggregatilineales bacterium]
MRGRVYVLIVSWIAIAGILVGCGGTTPPTPTPTVYVVVVTRTPEPTKNPNGAADHGIGPASAYLTITFYGDFQSDLCAQLARSLAVIQSRYPDDVRIVWRHFPQATDDKANLAAQAAEAASAQGRFREMHDQLFLHQPEWKALPIDQFRKRLDDYARASGVADLASFDRALDGGAYASLITTATEEALASGIAGVPALLFNNTPYDGRMEEFALDGQTRLRLLEKRWYASQPEFTINQGHRYTATLTTAKGDIVVELYPRSAPAAVNNFVFLARAGWYNGTTFDRVLPGQYAQTGDPSGTGLGTAGYRIVDEHDNGLKFDREGQVAMVESPGVPNSASAQFFITYGPLRPAEDYDGQYTIFGHVLAGMDVLKKLTPRDPSDELHFPDPPPGDKLLKVTIQDG